MASDCSKNGESHSPENPQKSINVGGVPCKRPRYLEKHISESLEMIPKGRAQSIAIMTELARWSPDGYSWRTNEAIAKALGIGPRQVIRYLNTLEDSGIIRRRLVPKELTPSGREIRVVFLSIETTTGEIRWADEILAGDVVTLKKHRDDPGLVIAVSSLKPVGRTRRSRDGVSQMSPRILTPDEAPTGCHGCHQSIKEASEIKNTGTVVPDSPRKPGKKTAAKP